METEYTEIVIRRTPDPKGKVENIRFIGTSFSSCNTPIFHEIFLKIKKMFHSVKDETFFI